MRLVSIFCMSILTVMLLSGCVSRGDADEKLARACEAGVRSLMPEGYSIDKVTGYKGGKSPVGPNYRHLTLSTIMLDGWLENEYDYECVFEEDISIFGMGYTASVYQIRMHDRLVGKSGGHLIGSAEEFIDLTEAVRSALYQ